MRPIYGTVVLIAVTLMVLAIAWHFTRSHSRLSVEGFIDAPTTREVLDIEFRRQFRSHMSILFKYARINDEHDRMFIIRGDGSCIAIAQRPTFQPTYAEVFDREDAVLALDEVQAIADEVIDLNILSLPELHCNNIQDGTHLTIVISINGICKEIKCVNTYPDTVSQLFRRAVARPLANRTIWRTTGTMAREDVQDHLRKFGR